MYALSLLIAICLSLHGLQTTASEPSSGKKHDADKTESKKPGETKSTPQGIGSNHEPSRITLDTAQQQYDPYSDRLYRVSLLATVIGVIGALVGLGALIAQTTATKTAANAAKVSAEAALEGTESLKNAERARIICKIRRLSEKVEYFGLSIRNCGRTPAHLVDVKWKTRFIPSDETLPDTPNYNPPTQFLHERILCAGDTYEAADYMTMVSPTELTQEGFDKIKASRLRYYIFGRVEYRDVFRNDLHETRFCFMYSPTLQEFIIFGPPEYTKFT